MASHSLLSEGSARRGRPRKDDRSELASRRERNRRAQRVLKAKRLQEQAEKDARISQLEATVDDLAVMHLDLVDEILRSESMNRNTQLVQRLRDSIKNTLHLVKGSAIEKKPDDLDNNIDFATNSLQLAPSSLLDIDVLSAGSAAQVRNQAHALSAEITSRTVTTTDKGRSSRRGHTEQTEETELIPESVPNNQTFRNIFNTFGNGWTCDLPEPYNRFEASLGNIAGPTGDSLGISILEYTLHRAYMVLLHTRDPTENSVRQKFRFSLQKYSREELLFNLRWFLGPGYDHISILSGILFHGTQNPLENIPLLQFDIEAEPSGLSPSFMSSNDIVLHLSSLKMRSIQAGVFELTVEDDHKVWISKSLFLEELSNISVCLASGPGFPAEYLTQVIVSAAIWSSMKPSS